MTTSTHHLVVLKKNQYHQMLGITEGSLLMQHKIMVEVKQMMYIPMYKQLLGINNENCYTSQMVRTTKYLMNQDQQTSLFKISEKLKIVYNEIGDINEEKKQTKKVIEETSEMGQLRKISLYFVFYLVF